MKLKNIDREFLVKNGWTESGKPSFPLWSHPKLAATYPITLQAAQYRQLKDIHNNKGLYFFRQEKCSFFGQTYGYVVFTNDKTGKSKRINFFDSKEKAAEIAEEMNGREISQDKEFVRKFDWLQIKNPRKQIALTFYEKYGDFTYYVPTVRSLLLTCREVVCERAQEYFFETQPMMPIVSEEVVATWPRGQLKIAAENEWKYYKSRLRDFERDKEFSQWLSLAVNDDTEEGCLAAYNLLCARRNYEYESVEPICLRTVEENE